MVDKRGGEIGGMFWLVADEWKQAPAWKLCFIMYHRSVAESIECTASLIQQTAAVAPMSAATTAPEKPMVDLR